MTDSGEHSPYKGAHMGDESDALPRGEFNEAMKSNREAFRGIEKRLAAIESLLQAQTAAKIAEAREQGRADNRLDQLEKRGNNTSNRVWVVACALAGQFLWNFFGPKGAR